LEHAIPDGWIPLEGNESSRTFPSVSPLVEKAIQASVEAAQGYGELEDEVEVRAESVDGVFDDLEEVLLPQDGLDEGAAERAELVAWLRKLADADDRDFKPNEQAAIRREIEALQSRGQDADAAESPPASGSR
jgi:hypothetical protein